MKLDKSRLPAIYGTPNRAQETPRSLRFKIGDLHVWSGKSENDWRGWWKMSLRESHGNERKNPSSQECQSCVTSSVTVLVTATGTTATRVLYSSYHGP
jgi:hypothetical protein